MSYPSAPERPLRIVQSLPDRHGSCFKNGCDFFRECDKFRRSLYLVNGDAPACYSPFRKWKVIQ